MDWKKIWQEIKAYPHGVAEEVRKVDWPSRENTIKLTSAALLVIAVATLYVAGLDALLQKVMAWIITS